MPNEMQKGYSEELEFWDTELSLEGHFREFILNLLIPKRYLYEFPYFLLEYVSTLKNDAPEKNLSVIDVGSGPLSVLVYGHYTKRFNLIAIDPLADEYKNLLNKYEYEINYPLLKMAGEELEQKLGKETFDLVWCRNTLDHTQDPQKVFDQMVSILRPGGYLVLQSYVMEGAAQEYRGLHQHDIYLGTNNDLMCRSMVKGELHTVCIDCTQPVEMITSTEPTQEPREWLRKVWKKTPL